MRENGKLSVATLLDALPSPTHAPTNDDSSWRESLSFGDWVYALTCGSWKRAQIVDETNDSLFQVSFEDSDEADMWIDRYSEDLALTLMSSQHEKDLVSPSAQHTPLKGLVNRGNMCYLNSLLQQLYWREAFRDALLFEAPANAMDLAISNCFKSMQYSNNEAPVDATNVQVATGLEFGLQQDVQQAFLLIMDLLGSHPAVQILTGSIRHTLTYKNAQARSSFEDFNCLSLDVVGMETLEESLDAWTSPEFIHDFDWDQETPGVTISKHSSIQDLPRVLFIHLNRFMLNYETWRTDKVHSKLSFPRKLFSSHILRGIVVHIGDQACEGHYKSYVSIGNDQVWFEFNDEKVLPWNIDDRLDVDCFETAYLVVYEA
ncbi:hypothetical protein LEN26_000178 [Aphanomyces euteiches]|nr:hypothetical protein AeMF1_001059 [Aphanomyces euteiches]KAH9164139.1 hypothetical protein LEN26_000178 [Aphanomyces euteiches]KAH9193988.1 hypothetical protein AeNC1_004034 [Aphanomyces euteiches]